ncbi:MAG: sigma-70 family RNA polymerase sigma factor [Bacteroidota bacterium]
METQKIWNNYSNELYFFILKRVQQKEVANDVLQNTFLKIHRHIASLKDGEKAKAWSFQVARNEVINYFNAETTYQGKLDDSKDIPVESVEFACCFDRLINDLPDKYREVIEMVYVEGLRQNEVAERLGISLANTKARVRRAKEMLKTEFKACCKYESDADGKLIGEGNCSVC